MIAEVAFFKTHIEHSLIQQQQKEKFCWMLFFQKEKFCCTLFFQF